MNVDGSEGWLRLAAKNVHKSRNSSFFHIAIIRKGGKVIALAANRNTCHAEIAAMRKCKPGTLRNSECISLRFSLTMRLSSAKPCPECEAALRAAGVKRCLYSVPFDKLEKLNLTIPSSEPGRSRYTDSNYRVATMKRSWVD
jgi:tRNA(Arg) A34 adenosine deaminase TadA